jgi:uncharacterized protein (AIM24 family)
MPRAARGRAAPIGRGSALRSSRAEKKQPAGQRTAGKAKGSLRGGADVHYPAPDPRVSPGAFADVTFSLSAGQAVMAAAGAMVWKKSAESEAIGISLARKLGGGSWFVNRWTAGASPDGKASEVCFSPTAPGDVVAVVVRPGTPWTISRGGALCWDAGVEVGGSLYAAGIVPIGTEEGFVLSSAQATGEQPGRLWVCGFGLARQHVLAPGEQMDVDNGCLLASDIRSWTRVMAGQTLIGSLVGGEGLSMRLTGPGTVWTQNRNYMAFVRKLASDGAL